MTSNRSPEADPYEVLSAASLSFARTLDSLSVEMRARTVVNVFLNTNNETEFKALVDWTVFLFSNRTAYAVMTICLKCYDMTSITISF